MKTQRRKKISAQIGFGDYSPETLRYAAYAVSDAAYVFMAPAGRGAVKVEFTPKQKPAAGGPQSILRRFREELEDEKLRAAVFDANRELREFMILKALSHGAETAGAAQEDSGLTPEQEKELNELIAQVESEIKKEASRGKGGDPLGIAKTWEETHGAKPRRKNKKK